MEHARAQDLVRLRSLVTRMAAAGDDIGVWARANFEFHVVLTGLLTLVPPYSLLNVHALGRRGAA